MGEVRAAEEADPGPSSGEVLGAEFKNRRRKVVLGIVAALVAIGGIGTGVVLYGQRKAKAEANESYSALSTCLFGAEGAGDKPSVRFRKAQLGSMGIPEKDRGKVDGTAWPQRCGLEAQTLIERAKDAGLTASGDKDVGYWSDQLAKKLKAVDGQLGDASEAIDAVVSEATKAGLVAKASSRMAGPPAIAEAKSIEELVAAGQITKEGFPLNELQLEASPGERQVALVQDATISPTVFTCDFQEKGVVCSRLPENVTKAGHGLRLFGATDAGAAPLVFEGKRGEAGVYRSDTGEKLGTADLATGFASKSGAAYLVGWQGMPGDASLLSYERGATKPKTSVINTDARIAGDFFAPRLLWNLVVFAAYPPESEEATDEGSEPPKKKKKKDDKDAKKKIEEPGVYVRTIEAGGVLGDPTQIFPLPQGFGRSDDDQRIVGCKTDRATAIFMLGTSETDYLTFRIDDQWSKPLRGTFRGALSCDGSTVSMGGVSQGTSPWEGSIQETHCTTAECQFEYIEVKKIIPGGLELAPRANLIEASPLEDKMVVAWAAGDRGGIRVRVGPIRDLENAKEVVAIDDLIGADGKVGAESRVSDLRLIHAPSHVVLVLSTKAGVIALGIDASGVVTPEKITWN